jgi:ubiquinone/menaquinone biosynthesis C-methylase UbiE
LAITAEANKGAHTVALPHPSDPSRQVAWNGDAFVVDGAAVRVLAYDVSQSGWTDELTQLHEEVGGSDHFIDVASRNDAIEEVTRSVTVAPSTVLEIGCSSGFLLRELLSRLPGHRIIGADYTRGTLEALAAKMPGVPLVQFDLTKCPLPDAFVDVAVLINVLEHIDDHKAAVAQLFRIVRPGGSVIIEVPANSSLFDVYDRVLMHYRRYNMPDLVNLLTGAGFEVERRSHLGFLLYPAFYLAKRLNQIRYRRQADVNEEQLVAGMIASTRKSSGIMSLVMRFEGMLRRYFYLPVGIRCLVTCRKPGGPSQ